MTAQTRGMSNLFKQLHDHFTHLIDDNSLSREIINIFRTKEGSEAAQALEDKLHEFELVFIKHAQEKSRLTIDIPNYYQLSMTFSMWYYLFNKELS